MTAPTVTVLPKPETVLDVDLSAEVPCVIRNCLDGAHWACVPLPCRHSFVCCERHMGVIRSCAEHIGRYRCDDCHGDLTDVTFRRL